MKQLFISVFIVATVLQTGGWMVSAQEGTTQEINALNDEIAQRQRSIEQLNRQIEAYQTKIEQKQSEAESLYGEIDLIENRVEKTRLDIEATQAQTDIVHAQIALLEGEIRAAERQMQEDRERVAQILREIEVQDNALTIELFFGADSFSVIFDALDQLERIGVNLREAVEAARSAKKSLLAKRESQEAKMGQLEDLQVSLTQEQRRLEDTIGAKETLLRVTRESETQFQELLYELRQEQAYINQQVALLQREIEGKLEASDLLGSSILSWPIDPTIRGISATFHDPTYPFRNLFEHSGLDLPAPTGTPVQSAASGYVAWTRQGRLYGNYVMVIHAGGIATLYAHLSRIDVVPDQFVARGDQIGAVGSTGFSTGPHVHFETRVNGIPTDPLDYLISY